MDAPLPRELLKFVDILSPNESELSRLTGMRTETFEQISQAVSKCYEMVGLTSFFPIPLGIISVFVMFNSPYLYMFGSSY